MSKVELEILGLSSSQTHTGNFALVLGEIGGKRRLPIIIGMFEAQAIAMEIENIVPNRPMTHDLFKAFSSTFNFKISEIIISDLRDGIFYARIMCSDGEKEFEIDSRPSDAIAIGIRFGVPIFAQDHILDTAGLIMDEEESKNELINLGSETEEVEAASEENASFAETVSKASLDELKKMLSEAIGNEEYEKAAKIRDELGKRS